MSQNLFILNNLKFLYANDISSYIVGTDSEKEDKNAVVDYSLLSETITIPEFVNHKKVTKIGRYAFRRANKLKRVYINAQITLIGNSAFDQCYNLEYVNIPSSVEVIEFNAFCLSKYDNGTVSQGTITIIIQPQSNLTELGNGAISNKENIVISYCGSNSFEKCGTNTFLGKKTVNLYSQAGVDFCPDTQKTKNEIPKDVLCPFIPPMQTFSFTSCIKSKKVTCHFCYIFLLYSKQH